MLFSVVVPVYNVREYLPECLASVSAQTYDDYELVIVDDGSADGSGEIADDFAAKNPNTLVLHGPNEGPLLARRRGLSHCRGEYVVFLDADDTLRSDALEAIADAAGFSGPDIVSFHYSRKCDFSTLDDPSPLRAGLYSGAGYEDVREHVCAGRFNNLCGKAVRLSRIDVDADYEAYRGLMHGEDWFQLLPIVDAASSLDQLDEILYFYRPNESSSTARYRDSQLGDIVRVSRRLREYAQRWGGRCPAVACAGEVLQYIYLLKISELSDADDAEKKANFESICSAMRREGAFERAKGATLRPDNKLIVRAMAHGDLGLARLAIKLVEVSKR